MNRIVLASLVLSAGLLSACAPRTAPAPEPVVETDVEPLEDEENDLGDDMQNTRLFTLTEQNDSGQSGTALFANNEFGKAVITLTMSGEDFSSPQPAHIHVGSCPTPGAVEYPLADVIDGESESTLNVSVEEIFSMDGALAINVHKSSQESNVYTACGDIK